jgi:valyl-tRNA synthetase
MRQGARLITKLWNAARLLEAGGWQLAAGESLPESISLKPRAASLFPVDRALLSWLQRLIAHATERYRAYDYAAALDATERFFWGTFCDNYLELVKGRLYEGSDDERQAARWTLALTLLTVLKLLAPVMPHITEEIYGLLFAGETGGSIHTSDWPRADETLLDLRAEQTGEAILAIASSVRRYKSINQLGLGTPLTRLTIVTDNASLRASLAQGAGDIRSVTRAVSVAFADAAGEGFTEAAPGLWLSIG